MIGIRNRIGTLLALLVASTLCAWIGGGRSAHAALGPPLWHVTEDSTNPAERPAILSGQRSLWCGKYDAGWPEPGYPNCAYEILYVDTGSHSSDYTLSLLMNFSAEWTYDFLYLVGGGGGAADPIGANTAQLDQAIASGVSGTARRLVSWTGSFAPGPATASIDATGGAVDLSGSISGEPTTLGTSILIPAEHRALYFVLVVDILYSAEDALWPFGTGAVLDNVATSDNGTLYDEQVAAGGTDAVGGTVLVGTASSPILSARTFDRAPVIRFVPAEVFVAEGGTVSLLAVASDPDCVGYEPVSTLTADLTGLPPVNDAVYTPVPNPPGFTFQQRGVVTWHPVAGDLGDYYVTFTATNAGTGSATAIIHVVQVGTIEGTVTGTCEGSTSGIPLLGVTVDAFAVGSGSLLGTAVTDASGHYTMPNLPVTDYTVSLVTPLGYSAAVSEVPVTLTNGQTVTADFTLSCVAASGKPESSGFWKHQFGIATGGNGNARFDSATLCSFLSTIQAHFNNNDLNQVVIYSTPFPNACFLNLGLAKDLLNLGGSPAPIDKARQQVMALLLNVAANYLGLQDVISKDGATVSQAITYCDHLIDNPVGDRLLAAAIAEKINSGQMVNAGVIPLNTAQIAYRRGLALRTFRVTPNPGPGARTFQFAMGRPGSVRLNVYDVSGRLVRTLLNGTMEAGPHTVRWSAGKEGRDRVGSGIYFARLETEDGAKTLKVILMAR